MLILGIETSCDETSAAVVRDGRLVRSNVVSSQIALHAPYGGVVPEIASRQHVRVITTVVDAALREAEVTKSQIELVASTRGPGLAGALIVGTSFGRALALGLRVPFVGVNHLEGHLHSVWLTRLPPIPPAPALPLLALIVSGGHTELVLMRAHGENVVVGRTLDDAAGEAFDKVARLLGLGYPGGPAIERVAASAASPVDLPRAWLPGTFNFSFSGLKTAALYAAYSASSGLRPQELRGKPLPPMGTAPDLTEQQVADIAAGFQESVVDVLVRKTITAAAELDVASVAVVGGVAANGVLRARMQEATSLPLYVSEPAFATDNAAMIAAAAYFLPDLSADADVDPSLELDTATLTRSTA